MMDACEPADRRPLSSRNLPIVQRAAAWLIARRVAANSVSLSSIVFAAAAALCLAGTARADGSAVRVLFVCAALFIQARLLANLLDGMIAVGSGRASALGELYNEVPDRAADALILVGAGFAAGGTPELGYIATIVAIFVTYVRALGSSLGVRALFMGPMAKPQRMAAVTAACIYCACAPAGWAGGPSASGLGAVSAALGAIVIGGVVTAVRRLDRIAAHLREAR
jgi:phosphatidylglycerophosphate synthase